MTGPDQNAPPPSRSGDAAGVVGRISALIADLTDSERRLAEVVLEAAPDLSACTAGELARRAGVSGATAARFFRRLGYDSYADVRRVARIGRPWGSPLDALERGAAPAPADFARHIAHDIDNLTRAAAQIDPADIATAVALLAGARRVWVIGFRNSAALAAYARGLLAHVTEDVRLLPIAGQAIAEDLAGLGPGDALLVFGFRRRPPVLAEILAWARQAGTPAILVADPTAARTAQRATVTLRCPNKGPGLFDSYVAPIALINHLASALGAAAGPAVAGRLAAIEDLHERFERPD